MNSRAWLEKNSLDFSFSGLKSALLNFYITQSRGTKTICQRCSCCFQEAVIDVLVEKTVLGAVQNNVKTVMMVGGVASNKRLRLRMRERLGEEGVRLVVPSPELCTDNAAMIGCAAYYKMRCEKFSDLFLNAVPNLGLDVGNYQ